MPTKRQPPVPPMEIRRFTPAGAEGAIGLLQARIADVKAFNPERTRYDDERVHAAERRIRSTILEVFGENSPECRDHRHHEIKGEHVRLVMGGFGDEVDHGPEYQHEFATGLPKTITMLEALIETVKERTDHRRHPVVADEPARGASTAKDTVFVVHGHKEGPREAVARFIERLHLKPVILHEQASEGKTVIEKFEKHADVGYAVVLLTGDDRGGLATSDPSTYALRARQNVIGELGYFVGKLGRSRVCVLYEQGVEVPSDFHGVVYVPLAADGAWKLSFARELKVAGFDIDMNRAVE